MNELFRGELDADGKLKQEYITEAIAKINTKKDIYEKIDKYCNGENTGIDTYLKKYSEVDRATYMPIKNALAQVPIRNMVGYMYKLPIKASYDIPKKNNETDDKTIEEVDGLINKIYWQNDEDILTTQLGEDQIKYGVAYELLYTNGDSIDNINSFKTS